MPGLQPPPRARTRRPPRLGSARPAAAAAALRRGGPRPSPAGASQPPKSRSSKLCSTYQTRRHYQIPLGSLPPASSPQRSPATPWRCSVADWSKTALLKPQPLPIGCLACLSGIRPEGGHVLTLSRSGLHRAAHQSAPDGAPIGQSLRRLAARRSGSCSLRRRRRPPAWAR